jgi:integrase
MGRLTALSIKRATKRGMYADGNGLYLQVGHNGGKSWIFRYVLAGRMRYMGLGSASVITLARARELAMDARRLKAEGIDPVATKHAQRASLRLANAKQTTFAECAENYMAAHQHAWKSARYREQWRLAMDRVVYPVIGSVAVRDVDTGLVLRILQPIWHVQPATAARIRGHIEVILDAAKSQDLRNGDNPARWRGHLSNLLPATRSLRKVVHLAALPYADVPGFMEELRSHPSISARALEFTILTAARTGEVLGARWSEIDFERRIWTIPGARMKAGKEHRVPLSPRALEILKHLDHGVGAVFPGQRSGGLSSTSLIKFLGVMGRRGITVHGFRSAFRDWASECTNHSRDVVEMALAHAISSAVEAAYRRGDLFDKRRKLMLAWANYCSGVSANRRG